MGEHANPLMACLLPFGDAPFFVRVRLFYESYDSEFSCHTVRFCVQDSRDKIDRDKVVKESGILGEPTLQTCDQKIPFSHSTRKLQPWWCKNQQEIVGWWDVLRTAPSSSAFCSTFAMEFEQRKTASKDFSSWKGHCHFSSIKIVSQEKGNKKAKNWQWQQF